MAFAGTYSGGSGTPDNPYKISSITDWQEMIDTSADWDKNFILLNDIDFGGATIKTIATGSSSTNGFQGVKFTGNFDGNAHIVQNMVVGYNGSEYVGLFGNVGHSGRIQCLSVKNVSVSENYCVGGICGNNSGYIIACYTKGESNAKRRFTPQSHMETVCLVGDPHLYSVCESCPSPTILALLTIYSRNNSRGCKQCLDLFDGVLPAPAI